MERDLVLVALFAALIAALGLVPQFMLATGVPITAQSMGVMLAGTVLGARRGALAVLLFVVLVALGLPLLAGGRGGLGVLQAPSAGFFLGFPIAAFATGWIMERLRRFPATLAAFLAALIGGVGVLYVPGALGLAFFLEKSLAQAAAITVVYLPGDLVKAALTAAITAAILRARPASVLSRQG